MIHYFTPWCTGDLGKAYNDAIHNTVTYPGDWICLRDGDTMFLNDNWGNIITEYTKVYADYGLLSCLTNRIFPKHQLYGSQASDNSDILFHRKIADEWGSKVPRVQETQSELSGFFLLFPIETWEAVGGFSEGILGVDWDFSRKVRESGRKLGVMQTLYLFHYYRLHKHIGDTTHLK